MSNVGTWRAGPGVPCIASSAPLGGRTFTLDDEPVDIFEFLGANPIEEVRVVDILGLEVGGEIRYGGGAAAEAVLRRTA